MLHHTFKLASPFLARPTNANKGEFQIQINPYFGTTIKIRREQTLSISKSEITGSRPIWDWTYRTCIKTADEYISTGTCIALIDSKKGLIEVPKGTPYKFPIFNRYGHDGFLHGINYTKYPMECLVEDLVMELDISGSTIIINGEETQAPEGCIVSILKE